MSARITLLVILALALIATGCTQSAKCAWVDDGLNCGFDPPDGWVFETDVKLTTFRMTEGTAYKSRLEITSLSDKRFAKADFQGWAEGFRISMERNGLELDSFEIDPKAGYFEAQYKNHDGEKVIRRTRHTDGATIHLSGICPPEEEGEFMDMFRETLATFRTW